MAVEYPFGFIFGNTDPADSRSRFTTLAARDALSIFNRYEGLITYIDETEKSYQLVGGIANENWVEFGGGSGGGAGGGGGVIKFISSSNINPDLWTGAGALTVEESDELVRDTVIKWVAPAGNPVFKMSPAYPIGGMVRRFNLQKPTILQCSGFIKSSVVASDVLVYIIGFNASMVQTFQGGTLISLSDIVEGENFSFPFAVGNHTTTKFIRFRITLLGSEGGDVFLEDIEIKFASPQEARKMRVVTSDPASVIDVTSGDDIIIVKPDSGINTPFVVAVPTSALLSQFTVKYVPNDSDSGVVFSGLDPSESGNSSMYANESKTFIFDYSSNIWRMI